MSERHLGKLEEQAAVCRRTWPMSSLAVMRPPFLVVSDLRPPGDPRNPCGAGLVFDLGGGTSGDGRKQRETSLRGMFTIHQPASFQAFGPPLVRVLP